MAVLCILGAEAQSKPPLKKAAAVKQSFIVESGRKCPSLQPRLRKWIRKRLGRTNSWRWRTLVSRRLSASIVKESSRHRLDPVVMATIAWIESDYRPWLKGPYRGKSGTNRRAAEVGAFQLIPGDYPVRLAWRANKGCKPRQRRLLRHWRWIARGSTACHAPDIIKLRSRVGLWNRYELRDMRIGTYIAGFELVYHLRNSLARYPKPKWPQRRWVKRWRKKNPAVNEVLLTRYAFYNTGVRRVPKRSYRRKLLLRYPRVRNFVCSKATPAKQRISKANR
jgi:hypothetical protein